LSNVQQLQQYHWPGNIREIQHVIERAVITSERDRLAISLPSVTNTSAQHSKIHTATLDNGHILTDAELRQLQSVTFGPPSENPEAKFLAKAVQQNCWV
jgi:transcriptional regulator with PAS, ATPase and Fis domain